jgi:hypothetical protein
MRWNREFPQNRRNDPLIDRTVMERHLSTGVATIVALMAAHRAASGREGAPVAFCQEAIDRIAAYLSEDACDHRDKPCSKDRQAGAASDGDPDPAPLTR